MSYWLQGRWGGGPNRYVILGPNDLEAGEAETEELADRWCKLLDEREPAILDALEPGTDAGFDRAEDIWEAVEAAARGQA